MATCVSPRIPLTLTQQTTCLPHSLIFSTELDRSGKGLSEEITANLISAFKRSSNDSGFGLGLAICAKLCQSIGSELHYTRLDKGGEFSFRLPLISPA